MVADARTGQGVGRGTRATAGRIQGHAQKDVTVQGSGGKRIKIVKNVLRCTYTLFALSHACPQCLCNLLEPEKHRAPKSVRQDPGKDLPAVAYSLL